MMNTRKYILLRREIEPSECLLAISHSVGYMDGYYIDWVVLDKYGQIKHIQSTDNIKVFFVGQLEDPDSFMNKYSDINELAPSIKDLKKEP